MSNTKSQLFCLLIFTIFIFVNLSSDSWVKPSKMEYISSNKKFTFVTKPGFSVLLTLKKCRGILYENVPNGKSKKIWSKSLVNDLSPYGALIHNEGKFVVTFNDYAHLGYGDNVVVIYDDTGKLIKRFSLYDILDHEDIIDLSHSVSSIWWMGHHTIIESQNILVLEIPLNFDFASESNKFEYVLIELNTGNLVENFKSYNKLNEQQILYSKDRSVFFKIRKYNIVQLKSILANVIRTKIDTLLGVVHPIVDDDIRPYYESPISIKTLYAVSPELCLEICYFQCSNFPKTSIKEASIIGSFVKDERLSAEFLTCFNKLTELFLQYKKTDDLRLWNEYNELYSDVLNVLIFQKPDGFEKILIQAFDQFQDKAEETKNNYRNVVIRILMTILHGSAKEVEQFQFYKYISYLLISQLTNIDSKYNIQKSEIESEIPEHFQYRHFLQESNYEKKTLEESIEINTELQTITDIVNNPELIEEVLNNLQIVQRTGIEVSYNKNLCNPIIADETKLAFSFDAGERYVAILSLLDNKMKIKVIGSFDVFREKY
ncbi:hypothetical protein ACFLYJ_03615 [Candidatus Cloacimonadota bacterium]